jgi:two-component sensor histidine kinase
MTIRGSWHDPILINTMGHTAGVLLFGLIIALLIRDWRTHKMRQIRLPLIAAILALGWNIGSLIVLASPEPGSRLIETVTTASFSMLSLLPAVLLHVVLHGQYRLIAASGYLVSACAAALHFSELFSWGAGLHQAGLVVIVGGFGILTVIVLLLRRNGVLLQRSEWISPACLLLFTTSFLHFGYHHTNSPWAAEIAWHHIGIPLALIVLLRDYRFLLLDTFIRFLVNAGLAAVYVSAVLVLAERFHLWSVIGSSMFLTGISLVSLCLSLILFAYLRNALQGWVNRVIFRRQGVDECERAISKLATSVRSEDELLASAARKIAEHFRTDRFAIVAEPGERSTPVTPSLLVREQEQNRAPRVGFHPDAQIPLRFSSGDTRRLILGARRGGRRYWSDDLDDMRRLGVAIVEQVERFRAEELKHLASEAELRALRAQINPHFLFNALNTLYGTIDRRSRQARSMVLNLAEMFRYFLQGDRSLISLSEELRIVEAYLEIEVLRLGERLKTEITVSEPARAALIPALSIQPLVENAVKHGIAAKQEGGLVSVRAENAAAGLRVIVEDTGIGFEQSRRRSQPGTGLGLENVRRRLALSYGTTADLQIESSDAGTTITLLIPQPAQSKPIAGHIEVEA